jgi:hypothetical protein
LNLLGSNLAEPVAVFIQERQKNAFGERPSRKGAKARRNALMPTLPKAAYSSASG